jgi:hypothetical protein
MVLLGYADTFQPSIAPTVTEELIEPIRVEHLIEFFRRAFRERNVDPDEDQVTERVDAVLDDLDPARPDFVILATSKARAELRNI